MKWGNGNEMFHYLLLVLLSEPGKRNLNEWTTARVPQIRNKQTDKQKEQKWNLIFISDGVETCCIVNLGLWWFHYYSFANNNQIIKWKRMNHQPPYVLMCAYVPRWQCHMYLFFAKQRKQKEGTITRMWTLRPIDGIFYVNISNSPYQIC